MIPWGDLIALAATAIATVLGGIHVKTTTNNSTMSKALNAVMTVAPGIVARAAQAYQDNPNAKTMPWGGTNSAVHSVMSDLREMVGSDLTLLGWTNSQLETFATSQLAKHKAQIDGALGPMGTSMIGATVSTLEPIAASGIEDALSGVLERYGFVKHDAPDTKPAS